MGKKILLLINLLLLLLLVSCSEETLLTMEEENAPHALTTRSIITVRCADAYVDVGGVSEYKGTYCWQDHGSSAPSLPVGAIPSAYYTPNGYPFSQGGSGGGGGFSSGTSWYFEFRNLQSFMGDCTGLNLLEKEKLTNVLAFFIGNEKASVYKTFYNFMRSKSVIVHYTIGQTLGNVPAQYDRSTKTITFGNIYDINFEVVVEEYVHALQDQYFYGSDMLNSRVNCEFEAKVFADIANLVGVLERGNAGAPFMATIGQTTQFETNYIDWIINLVYDRGAYFSGSDAAMFRDFCLEWTGYQGSYSSSFNPRLLSYFFNKAIKF